MSNQTPIITYIYNRYGKATATKTAAVEMRITYKRKQKYMSTGIRLLPKEWNRGRAVNRLDAPVINQTLDKMLFDVRKIICNMIEEGDIDIFSIPAKLEEKRKKGEMFYAFCEERTKIRQYGKTADSQERYNRFLRFLKAYGKIRSFNDLNESKIMELDKYLKNKNDMKAKSRWNNYHRFLNSFILDAQKERLIERNPYDSVRIDHGDDRDGINKYLSPSEFAMLKDAKLSCERLEKVRDLFVFHCYTCLSYHDLHDFDAQKIQIVEGKRFYEGRRGKTNVEFTIPILSGAQAILDKYNGKLPILSNVKYNEYIKEVVKEVGINKHVTTHWARHTGATLLLNAGVSMQTVSKICGHSSIKMTEKIYAKLLPETVVRSVYEIEDKIT